MALVQYKPSSIAPKVCNSNEFTYLQKMFTDDVIQVMFTCGKWRCLFYSETDNYGLKYIKTEYNG